jgi:hypothetical protein
MTLIEFLFAVLVVALIVLDWVKIAQQRCIVDALYTLIAQNSKRRGWAKAEHEG